MAQYKAPGQADSLVSVADRYGNFIGGEWVPPVSGRYFENITPVTGQPFTEIARSTDADIKGSSEMAELNRVQVTDTAADLLRNLTPKYGPLMFHQSGGCCDGSSPMCYPDGEFITSDADVLLGQLEIAGVERPISFWMPASQYEYWKHTHFTVDVVKGRGSGFSVEAPEGVRFLIRSRLLTDDELSHFSGSRQG